MAQTQQTSILSQLLTSKEGSALTGTSSSYDQFFADHAKYDNSAINGNANQQQLGDHRRAVSTLSEADNVSTKKNHFFPIKTFFSTLSFQMLPQLTSPLSPPAFNPADIILGSNEAIAG